jgi:tetratricopeptide (TPR) repeat protein
MSKFHVLVHSLLLATSPSLLAYPQCQEPVIEQMQPQEKSYDSFHLNYDDVLKLLQDVEQGRVEEYSAENIDNIRHFISFLADQGKSNNYLANAELSNDIADLFTGEEDLFDYTLYCNNDLDEYSILPAALLYGEEAMIFLCKHKHKKDKHCHHSHHDEHRHKKSLFAKIKRFIKKHKRVIIIGTVIIVAAAVVIVAVAASSAAAATAAGAAASAAAASESNGSGKGDSPETSSSPPGPKDVPPGMAAELEAPTLKAAIDNQIFSFKENIDQHFQSTNPTMRQQNLSLEENGRALGSIFAHDSYKNLHNEIPYNPSLSQEIQDINSKYGFSEGNQSTLMGHAEIDKKFTTDYSYLYANAGTDVDFYMLSHQVLGEKALSLGYYDQAIQDLDKAIAFNPTNPLPYLERGIAHFGLGQYDRSIEDYKQFTSQTHVPQPNTLSVSEFSLGFAKGLPQGVYESGEGLFLFMADFVQHPIHTSKQVVESVATLVNLVRSDEWGVVAEALSPEVYQLVTQWDTLSSEKKGELAGYAVGKYGADILIPGALAKVASKSIKSAQELTAVCRNLQIAQETLILETAVDIGNSAKIGEIIRNGQSMMALGEEVGLTAHEIAQLKQAGKLEGTINSGLEKLVSQSESEVFKAAVNKNTHVKMVRDYLDKPAKEIQKGIRSYEKQIALHQEKISNPSKFIPHWDKLHPERQHALINKKWPAEIQCYSEQRDILQSILNERIN